MTTSRFSILSAIALLVGLLACYSVAAPANGRTDKSDAALVDEDNTKAPEAKAEGARSDAPAEEASAAKPAQSNPECENADQGKSDLPIFPIVMSAIGTVAFIVLAIIF